MNSPPKKQYFSDTGFVPSQTPLVLLLAFSLSLNACGGKLVKETVAEPKAEHTTPAPTSSEVV